MKHRWLLLLFPRAWRERYGDEFDALLDDLGGGPSVLADVLLAALRARSARSQGARTRVVIGVAESGRGGAPMTIVYVGLAVIAAAGAFALFVLHSFLYLMVVVLAVVFVFAAAARQGEVMRNVVRVLFAAFALVVLLTTVAMTETPAGRTLDGRGLLVDLSALVVLGVIIAGWLRERREKT